MARDLKLEGFTPIYVVRQLTEQLVCAFVFAYAEIRFSHDVAQMEKVVHHIKDRYLSA